MAIFIDLKDYQIETEEHDGLGLKVTRKADDAFFRMEEGAGSWVHELLWLHVHGDGRLKDHAQDIIDEIVAGAQWSGDFWTYPKGVLAAWGREFRMKPDPRRSYLSSDAR